MGKNETDDLTLESVNTIDLTHLDSDLRSPIFSQLIVSLLDNFILRHRDVRPNDGFLRQIADLDNKLRRERGQLAKKE